MDKKDVEAHAQQLEPLDLETTPINMPPALQAALQRNVRHDAELEAAKFGSFMNVAL